MYFIKYNIMVLSVHSLVIRTTEEAVTYIFSADVLFEFLHGSVR